jgi:hypothetical protein
MAFNAAVSASFNLEGGFGLVRRRGRLQCRPGGFLVPIEHTIPAPARYTLYHQGRGEMLDHMLITRNLLAHYRGSEIHNEILRDESAAFAIDRKYPESDHAPVVATFDF